MKWKTLLTGTLLCSASLLGGCTYNPFIENNHTTGSPVGAVAGAAVGVAGVGAFNGPKPLLGLAGIGGGIIGYYMTTLRYDSGGVITAGGQVYRIGDFLGIYIPTDKLFDPNSSELLPRASAILDSVAAILQRYPDNNILVSGNTSGFYRPKWEQKLSEERAKQVTAYLWNAGISSFKGVSMNIRKLNYVGYGDYFPLASTVTNDGIRENSRIQVTTYPSNTDLKLDKRHVVMRNIGAMNDDESNYKDDGQNACGDGNITSCFKG